MTTFGSGREGVQSVDITGNERRLEARLTSMQRVREQFTRGARRSLPFLVRRRGKLVGGALGPLSHNPMEPSGGPTCQIYLEAPGRAGWAAIRLDTGAIQLIVDGSLGGGAPDPNGEETEPVAITQLTLAQRALVTRVARALGTDFADACREEVGAGLEVVRAECMRPGEEPQLPREAAAAECIFEGVPGRACIWLFASGDVLESGAREKAAAEVQTGDPRMVQAMSEVPLEVVAELGRVKLGLRKVLSLKVGEVLRLTTATDDPIQVRVGDMPKLTGVPVLSRGQLAVQITGRHAE
jgi:flagellar motor switch/type III secretory pathway protein FliN